MEIFRRFARMVDKTAARNKKAARK